MARASTLIWALLLASSCTTPPLDTRATQSPRFTVIPAPSAATRTSGIAPVAAIEGSSGAIEQVAVDGGALSILIGGLDGRLHLARAFPQGDLQDMRLEIAAQSSPWGLGLTVGPDGSRWIGGYRSVARVRPDRSLEELPIPASRPPGLAAEAGRNGEVTAIFVDDTALYLGRAGIPVLTRVDLLTGRMVTLALPPDMPDVGTIARGPGGDLFLAANHRTTRFAPEPTARVHLATESVEALPYRGRPLAANSSWLAVATPDIRIFDASLHEARPPIPAAQVDGGGFAVLSTGELVAVDAVDAALVFYDVAGRVTRRVGFQARVVDGRPERRLPLLVADGTAVWLVWGLDVFRV